jgi:hypothetical protein
MKSKGPVRGFIIDKGKFLVAFTPHDGYFHTNDRALQKIIREAHQDGREISFTFDRDLKILSIE